MNLPKSYSEANQRKIATTSIEWDGEAKAASINIPLAVRPLHIAIDNAPNTALTMTMEHLLRIDDTNASAQIGEGTNGVVTITAEAPGAVGDEYSVEVVVPTEVEEATDLAVELNGKKVIITLAVDAEGTPDDTKNTAVLIVTAINDKDDGIAGFTAEASGDGSGVFQAAVEEVKFTGGTTPAWASLYDSEGNALQISVAAQSARVFGPYPYFPRFLGGRITLTAASAPDEGGKTIVQVIEG